VALVGSSVAQMYEWYTSYMKERRISEARESFAETLNRAAYGGERVVLTRHGKRLAAVVPIEDLELLESLEDAVDLEAAREVLADGRSADWVAWEEVKRQLNLD
jgi:prevent-host-death family protein